MQHYLEFYNKAQAYFSETLLKNILLTAFSTIAIFILIRLALWGSKNVLLRTRFKSDFKKRVEESFEKISKTSIFCLALFLSLEHLSASTKVEKLLSMTLLVIVVFQLLTIVSSWIHYFFSKGPIPTLKQKEFAAINNNLSTIAIFALWGLSILILLENFGINVGAIIAGLGVGGLAIGLAMQSVFGDLIASFTIGLDRPFEIGDLIQFDGYFGTVEKVGLKTTKIRNLTGELLIIPNSSLVNARIKNYKKMEERRISYRIGVTYDTDLESLKEIPTIIQKTIEETPMTRFDRAHFTELSSYQLSYDIVYYILSPQYLDYVNAQQQINLKLTEYFRAKNIDFAFPTQSIDLLHSSYQKVPGEKR